MLFEKIAQELGRGYVETIDPAFKVFGGVLKTFLDTTEALL